MARRRYTVTLETRSEHLSMIAKDVFVASVVRAPKHWRCGIWKAVRDTREDALSHLSEAIRNAYPKHDFTFVHARG